MGSEMCIRDSLSHDHFQGGHYTFAMEKAEFEKNITIPGFEDVEAGIVHWPLSVIRIRSNDDERLVELADHILKAWRGYTDEDAFVFAAHLTVHQIGFKLQPQVVVLPFVDLDDVGDVLPQQFDLQLAVGHIEPVIQHVVDGVAVDGYQSIPCLNPRPLGVGMFVDFTDGDRQWKSPLV